MRAERFGGSWPVRLWVVVSLGLSAVGCTDEPRKDLDRSDAATDAGEDPDLLPRRDGAVLEGDPIPECADRFSPTACPAGLECDVVVRRAPDAEQFTIYTGCIDTGDERLAGEPCVPWGGLTTPIVVEGLIDEAYHDPCGPGLFCAPSPKVRGLYTCQPSCDSAGSGLPPRGCDSDGDYCTGPGAFEEVCVPGDDCDPRDPAACGAGQGCYLRFNHDASAAISVCLPELPAEDPAQPDLAFALADGEQCLYVNHCKAGSSCWGPSSVSPAAWDGVTDWLCRRSCELPEGADGGLLDDDAGAGGTSDEDGCEGPLSCSDLGDFVSVDEISVSFGQCE